MVPEAGATRHVSQVSAWGRSDHPTNGTKNDSRGLVSHLLAPSFFFPFYTFFIFLKFYLFGLSCGMWDLVS